MVGGPSDEEADGNDGAAAEEDDDYRAPADEDEEEEATSPPPPPPPPPAPRSKAGGKEEKKAASGKAVASSNSNGNLSKLAEVAYLLYNKKAYEAPLALEGTKAGRVRDFGRPIWVSDGDKLAEMGKGSAWPAPADVHPLSIVVVKGLVQEGQALSSAKDQGPYVWYARIGIEGKPDGDDLKIIRPVPREFVKKFVAYLSQQDAPMCHSSLITKYQPEGQNAKHIALKLNESFKERPDVKLVSEATKTSKKAAAAGPSTAEEEGTQEQKTPSKGAAGTKKAAAAPAASGKKVVERKPAPPAPPADKKQNTLPFGKKAAEEEEAAAAEEEEAAAEEAAEVVAATPNVNGKRPKENDDFPKMLPLTYKKRARILVGLKKETTHVLWEGDNLYIIPFDPSVVPTHC